VTADALILSLKVTLVATAGVVVVGILLGLLLARTRFFGRTAVEALVTLPLVLPPTVVGYYLLTFLGSSGPLVEWFGIDIVFTWWAAAFASFVVGLPLMVQSAKASIASVDPVLENAARTLGSSELGVFFRVTLPLARRGVAAGALLGGARALGEFGATLMVAGSIPGRTQTMPLLIYDAVQRRDYATANLLVLVMTLVAFFSLWAVRKIGES
jgi:molybdate transport system permease protein